MGYVAHPSLHNLAHAEIDGAPKFATQVVQEARLSANTDRTVGDSATALIILLIQFAY